MGESHPSFLKITFLVRNTIKMRPTTPRISGKKGKVNKKI